MPRYYYCLNPLFADCFGERIIGMGPGFVVKEMQFSCYCGIDMSKDYDGVCSIRLVPNAGSVLEFSGWVDYSSLVLLKPDGEPYEVKLMDLLADMTDPEYEKYHSIT